MGELLYVLKGFEASGLLEHLIRLALSEDVDLTLHPLATPYAPPKPFKLFSDRKEPLNPKP